MAHLDQKEAFSEFKTQVLKGIASHFPMEGRLRKLELERLEADDSAFHPDDIRSQHEARLTGKSWAVPVNATLVLRDTQTGDVLQRRTLKLAEIPHTTRRHGYILDGQEYQVDNQWQLKPGAYTRRRQSGELETRFNIPNNKSFDITFDPESRLFLMDRGKSKAIPIYPLMKVMGVDDSALEKQWGKDILAANQNARAVGTALQRFYKADLKTVAPSKEEAEKHFLQTMAQSKLRPDSTAVTLGHPFETVNGDALLRATTKMIGVQQGRIPEDDRDSLVFKDLRSIGDFAHDKLTNWKATQAIKAKVARQFGESKGIRDLIKFDTFNEPVRDTFLRNAAANPGKQINPVEMMSSAMRTTIMGPGGIKSTQAVMDEAKLINPSHLGFLDPIHTPESEKTGVSLHLPMGVKKMGRTPMIPAYNIQTGKMERVAPATFLSSNVVLPDQVTWKDNKPVPRSDVVKMAARGDNIVRQGKFNEAQYVMRHPSQMFSVTSNLVPFLGNNSGARATYATAHLEQAISLVNRDEPLVQVGTGSDKPGMRTFEEFLGRNTGHVSPVTGVVTKVSQDGVHIKGEDGKHREVQLYNNFPLNDPKAVFHSTPLVQVGDKVHEGQAVADTNYTKNGKLALGANLRVAYLPYKGYNFEDGVVISESAAKKLSSMHLHKPVMRLDKGMVSEPRKFNVQHPEAFTREQYKLLDERGIVKPGQVVRTGDPLVLGTRPFNLQDRTGAYAIRKNASGAHTDVSMRWESDYPGMVVGVHEGKKGEVAVHVRTIEPMQVGDKLTGRHGNKGIVTQVLPDHEMPKTKDGVHIDAALNPAGIPSRTNIGQVLETAASKIALKTGKPYIVENFLKSDDMLSHVENELKKHGLSDTEELIDPKTGISLGKALTGHQHMLKLTHQIDKKLSVRSGMSITGAHPESYDFNLMPASGGKTGGQSMGNLGLYALLAHGAKANIREMQTWKSEGEDPAPEHKQWKSQHKDVWAAIQNGDPLPVPKSTFAFQKFTDMLRASGINVEKQGNHFRLTPLTDKQVLGMSKGALPNPAMLTRADLDENGQPKPTAGGLFDPKITGGHDGKNWSHFKLAEPMPNPIFEGAIQKLIGMKGKDYTSLIHSERSIDKDTHAFVPLGTKNSITGGPAIAHMLSKLDVKAELAKAKSELAAAPMPKNLAFGADTGKVDRALKKIKYLSVLDELDLHPKDAYVIHNLPVIPPAMRPVSVLPGEKRVNIKWADLNGLYRDIAMLNKKMEHETFQKYLGDEDKREQRAGLYDGLKALMGVGANFAEREDKSKGLMLQIAGKQPKSGYFQKTLLNRRQDLTMRSTIVPEPSLGLDQVGLPTEKALSLFRPFVVKKMVDIGVAEHPLDAQKQLGVKGSYKNPNILKALDLAMEERPILLKRDPVLHKHGVQAFHAIRAPGRAIQIHPLVTGGYNADFDGDTMSAYVPISKEAVAEARKMFPSNNLYNESTGKITYAPTQESALGLYKLTLTGNQTTHKFGNPAELLNAAHKGTLGINDVAHVSGVGHTTAGRVLLASALPEPMQKKVLTDHSFLLDKGNLPKLLMDVSKQHSEHFGAAANRLKDLGYDASFGLVRIPNPGSIGEAAIKSAEFGKDVKVIRMPTHTLSFVDFKADHGVRDAIVKTTQKKVDAINKLKIPQLQKDERAVDLWSKATKQMLDEHHAKVKKDPTNLSIMLGTGGSKLATGYQQVKLGPMLLADTSGRVIPTPVARSYSEGLDLAGYWTQMHGARKGTVQKVQEVQEPGFFTKQLINTSMSLMVNGDDCGTTRGIGLPVTSKDVHDRILATDFNVKGRVFPRGTVLSPDVVSHIRTADKTAIVPVRSPLKCEHAKGLCQKCAGLAPNGKHYELGTNVGILASQSVGEPSTQLALRLFHTGGIVESKKNVIGMFGRIQQLTSLPKKIPDAATLAMASGTIQKIHHDKLGTTVTIGGQNHFVPLDRAGRRLTDAIPGLPKPGFVSWSPLKVGMRVNAGDPLSDPSRTFVNPHDLYKATNNMEVVQNHIVNELHSLYEDVGVRRPHFETLVKAMGNLTRVRDPGDAPNILKGEYQQASNVRAINRELVARGKKPVEHTPILQGINVLPLSVQEDWMAKLNFARLRGTLSEAAATGGRTDLHGVHPIPGMAFGAEFGMTSEHARTHPHLKNVPRHGY